MFIFSLLLIALGIGGYALILKNTINDLNTQVATLTKKKASFQPTLKLIEDLKKEKKVLEAKLNAIKLLKKNSQLTVRILDEIAKRTPSNRLWLNSLSQTQDKLRIAGVALDNATIAQYMKELTNSELFTAAELANSSQTAVAGRKLKSFSLSLTIKKPAQEEETTEKNKSSKG